jgi:hypothetical protein
MESKVKINKFYEVSHLYFGCDVEFFSKKDKIYKRGKLKIIDRQENFLGIRIEIDDETPHDYEYIYNDEDIKPILYKLEDMDESFFKELYPLLTDVEYDGVVELNWAKNCCLELMTDPESVMHYYTNKSGVFLFLLSKSIDLYNLIDNNIAINGNL